MSEEHDLRRKLTLLRTRRGFLDAEISETLRQIASVRGGKNRCEVGWSVEPPADQNEGLAVELERAVYCLYSSRARPAKKMAVSNSSRRLVEAISKFNSEHGRGPKTAELAEAMGVGGARLHQIKNRAIREGAFPSPERAAEWSNDMTAAEFHAHRATHWRDVICSERRLRGEAKPAPQSDNTPPAYREEIRRAFFGK